MLKIFCRIISIMLAIIILSSSFNAFSESINNAYVSSDYWNTYVSSKSIRFSFINSDEKCIAKYVVDDNDKAIYLKFEFNYPVDLSLLKIHFDIKNELRDYHFAVDENGLTDFEGNEDTDFEIIQNFETSPMIGIRFIDNELINKLSLKVNYDGKNYKVINKLNLDFTPVTEPSTTKITTTKLSKEKSTKASRATTKTESKTKEKVAKTTVTKYIPNVEKHKVSNDETSTQLQSESNSEIYSNIAPTSNVKNKKPLIISGCVTGVICVLLFITYLIKKRKEYKSK